MPVVRKERQEKTWRYFMFYWKQEKKSRTGKTYCWIGGSRIWIAPVYGIRSAASTVRLMRIIADSIRA